VENWIIRPAEERVLRKTNTGFQDLGTFRRTSL